jgi:hypothetical protein
LSSSDAPTREIGTVNPDLVNRGYLLGRQLPGWTELLDTHEDVPALRWPKSIETYDRMRTNDAQIRGLIAARDLPVLQLDWAIDPAGADETRARMLADDLGLPFVGEGPRPRAGRRLDFVEHLRFALSALDLGHAFFELVGDIDDQGVWRLRKLADRPASSITQINVATDGGLVSIEQGYTPKLIVIPVDALVAYVWDRRSRGDWLGRSMLRPLYRHWLRKDRLLRVDAIKHERNGMGVPVAKATIPDVGPEAALEAGRLAASFRAGETAGAFMPYGTDLDLKSPTGQLPDAVASIRYDDQQMARAFLQMFAELGQTPNGSRALGGDLIDFFMHGERAVADWLRDVTQDHVIQDWWDWNVGPDVPCPQLVHADVADVAVETLGNLVQQGALTVDREVENQIRRRIGVAELEPGEQPAGPRAAPVAASRHRHVAAAAGESVADQSQADFEDLQHRFETALAALVAVWGAHKAGLINSLVAQVRAASTPAELAAIAAPTPDVAGFMAHLRPVVEHGAQAVVGEAEAQGVTLAAPALDDALARISSAAEGSLALMAQSLAQSAASAALHADGPTVTADDRADMVRQHLESLAGADAEYELAGLATKAQNAGRFAAMGAAPGGTRFYSSELNDENTCEACAAEDGTEFDSLDEAMGDYPSGYVGCLGGNRCRGTVVMVLPSESEPTS